MWVSHNETKAINYTQFSCPRKLKVRRIVKVVWYLFFEIKTNNLLETFMDKHIFQRLKLSSLFLVDNNNKQYVTFNSIYLGPHIFLCQIKIFLYSLQSISQRHNVFEKKIRICLNIFTYFVLQSKNLSTKQKSCATWKKDQQYIFMRSNDVQTVSYSFFAYWMRMASKKTHSPSQKL